jgi:hypothetical protein
MADDAELEITIIPEEEANIAAAEPAVEKKDATAETKPEPKVEAEAKDPALTDLAKQFKDLQDKEAETTRRLREAEQRAAESRAEAEVSKKRESSYQLDTITTAISASQQDAESAKRDIRNAKQNGDLETELEAIDRLASARATLIRLDEAKQDLEARQKAPPKPQAKPQLDAVEAFAQNRTPKTAAWIRAHPEYVTSERGIRKLTAADAVAQAEDLIPDTPEYFAKVEEYLGIGKAEAAPTEASQVAPKRSAAPPVAPGAQVSGGNPSVQSVQLTRREADAATDGTLVWNYDDPSGKKKFKKGDPIGLQEAARRKMSLTRQGLYDRTYAEG